jgi:hypothetical protein
MPRLFFSSFFLGLILISCKKERVMSSTPTIVQLPTAMLPPVNPLNTAPAVFAGPDIYMVFPANSCTLKGAAQYTQSVEGISWYKISGPVSLLLENAGSLETKLYNLEKGIYVFELRVTGKAGLTGRDTVSVHVLEEGADRNEIIFKDLQWGCPMGCHVRVENFHSIIPTGTAFKAYVKRDNSTQWIEVVNRSTGSGKYVWTIYNNGLEILEDQTEYPNDSPDVKIIF